MDPNAPTSVLESTRHGTGQPLVLVHGSASDLRTWEQQITAFSADFHVVAYSRRFHWPNVPIRDGEEYAMADHVGDLEQMLESLGATSAHLVGHSYGAYVALMVAIRCPALVDKLVLGEPPTIPLFTGFPPEPKRILQLLITQPGTALPIIRFLATGLVPAASAARKDRVQDAVACLGKAILGNDAFDALSASRLEQVRDNYIKAELLSDRFMMPLDEADVRSIRAPTLLVTGEKSPAVWHRLTEQLEQLIPDTRRVDIPNSSHIMHEDNATAYNQAVMSFLR